jgi:predicted RNA binding protein YcfA (HicA-like mRNA interferase family)
VLPDGSKRVAIVVLGKRQVPRGTLDSILKQAGLSAEEFEALL